MTIDNKVLAGREAAANYRDAHARLYAEGWKGKMEDEHERLLLNLNVELKALGFDSVDTFFKASADENARELGYKDRDELLQKGSVSEKASLREKWR
jgi:hypothetical protein